MAKKKPRGRPPKHSLSRIPDTFERVIKALVKPQQAKKKGTQSGTRSTNG